MAGDERQWPLERLIQGIDELNTVFGAEAVPAVQRVKQGLIRAMAARDRGDPQGTLREIAGAMGELAELGTRLDGAEGAMMRAVATGFVSSMANADRDEVERHMAIIESRTGAPKKEPRG
jgi:hypothetical protein